MLSRLSGNTLVFKLLLVSQLVTVSSLASLCQSATHTTLLVGVPDPQFSVVITPGIKVNYKCARLRSWRQVTWASQRQLVPGFWSAWYDCCGGVRDDGIISVTHPEQPNTALYGAVKAVTFRSLPRVHFPNKADNSPGWEEAWYYTFNSQHVFLLSHLI